MPLLARAKQGVNRVLDSSSLRADIAETVSCAYLAAVTLGGLGVSALTGWWWVQYVAALGLLVWLGPEAREALHERAHNGDDQGGEGGKRWGKDEKTAAWKGKTRSDTRTNGALCRTTYRTARA